ARFCLPPCPSRHRSRLPVPTRRSSDLSGPEILDALDHTGVEELETALDEDLLCEGVTDLHGWALRGLRVVEGFGSEDRGAADAVATGAGAEEHDLVAQPRGVGQADVFVAQHTHGEGVDQRVALVDGIEDG